MIRHRSLIAVIVSVLGITALTSGASADVRFFGLDQTYNSSGSFIQSSAMADLTPTGPDAATRRPLSVTLSDITRDPAGFYYGSAGSSVQRIDPVTTAVTNIPITDPNFAGHISGVTFDTARNRLVMASFSGEGALFQYVPATGQWSTLASLNNRDLHAILYRPSDDTVYGLPALDFIDRLERYGPNGQLLGSLFLSQQIEADTVGPFDYQLLPTNDGRFAVLTAPLDTTTPRTRRLYLIDPATGNVTYDELYPAVPEPASTAAIALTLATLLIARRPRGAERPKLGSVFQASV